jgi:hypothetical protein
MLTGLSARTGEVVWRLEIDAGTPDFAIAARRVFAGHDPRL